MHPHAGRHAHSFARPPTRTDTRERTRTHRDSDNAATTPNTGFCALVLCDLWPLLHSSSPYCVFSLVNVYWRWWSLMTVLLLLMRHPQAPACGDTCLCAYEYACLCKQGLLSSIQYCAHVSTTPAYAAATALPLFAYIYIYALGQEKSNALEGKGEGGRGVRMDGTGERQVQRPARRVSEKCKESEPKERTKGRHNQERRSDYSAASSPRMVELLVSSCRA